MPTVFSHSILLTVLFCVTLPGTLRAEEETTAKELSDYELMSIFVEAFEQIETNYVRDVDRRELLEAAVNGMVSHLDQYSNFIPPRRVSQFNQMVEQEFGGIGIQVNRLNDRLIVVSPIPGTPAHRAGIQSGDIIVEVEGTPIRGVTMSRAVELMQGPVGRPVTIKILHPGAKKPEEMTLVRQLIKAPTVRGDRYRDDASWEFMLPGEPRIGLIRISHFSRYTAKELKSAVEELQTENMQGLVVDLRGNPGGLLEVAIEMCDLFLEDGNIVSVRGRNVAERSWDARKNGSFPDFPLAVLVDHYSASASEVFSACLQDNERAVIIGERTWGKGSVQNVIRMEQGDSALKLTTASYHRPSGVNIHRFPDMKPEDQWGVTPDEGFLIELSRTDRLAVNRQRYNRDILKNGANDDEETELEAEATETESPKLFDSADEDVEAPKDGEAEAKTDTVVEDKYLLAAINYIQEQLSGTKIAEDPANDQAGVTVTVRPAKEESSSADGSDGK